MRRQDADDAEAGAISVLHLITSLEAAGAQTMLRNLVLFSEGKGLRHCVVTMTDGGPNADILRAHGIPVETLGMRRGRPTIRGALRFAVVLRRRRPRIVQSWLYHADLLGLFGRPLAGARVVWNVRSATHGGLDAFVTKACARLSSWPDAVVVNSEAGRRIHADLGYRPRRWCLISNGFDVDTFKPSRESRVAVRRELGLAHDTPLVGLIARWDALKGHDTFFSAAARLLEHVPSTHFLLAGEGITPEQATISAWLFRHRLGDRVHLLGPRSDVPHLTAALDVACCTSVGEAFPNVVGEAMACAVPCVVTDVGDVSRLLGNPEFVVPAGDVAALVDRWSRLLAMSEGDRRAIGERGRDRIVAHYSLDAIVGQYVALYRSLSESAEATCVG